MARRTYLVEIRENACQNTLVVRHFGGLWLPSSVNGEGSHWLLERLTTSVFWQVFSHIPTRCVCMCCACACGA